MNHLERFFYKLRFSEDYKLLNQRRNARVNKIPFENITNLYNERRKITKKKVFRFTTVKELNATRLPIVL